MIKKQILSNNVKIYILNDKYFNTVPDDFTIKLNNYGSILDIKNKIYGMQHLLEHSIFENYLNLNLQNNASTSFECMTIDLNFSSKYKNLKEKNDSNFKLIKKCLFKNNDFSRINISRNLNDKTIKQYINELDAEFILRSNLPIKWDLKTLLYSNEDVHYFGGNKTTLSYKIKEIEKVLKNPDIINPEDISIFLKKSKINYLNEIVNIFSQIKHIKKEPLKLKPKYDKFYNKIFKINEYSTNQLNFILPNKLFIQNYDILYIFLFLYPFFDFSIILDDIFITFNFYNIYDLFNVFNILKYSLYKKFSLENFYEYILHPINTYNLNDNFSEELINYFFNNNNNFNLTYSECYKKYEKQIVKFLTLLTGLIKENKFFLNITKDFIINKETNISNEKYLVIESNINDNFFLNKEIENFTILNLNLKLLSNNYMNNKLCCLKCFNKILIINENDNINSYENNYFRSFSFDVQNGKLVKYNNNCNIKKITYNVYVNALVLFFANSIFDSFKDCIKVVLENKNVNNIPCYNNILNIKFNKKEFLIKTGYEFLFCVLKISKKNTQKFSYLLRNIENHLKVKGLTYYLEFLLLNYNKFSLIFFFTQCDKENFLNIISVIKNIINLNYIKNDMLYIISEKSHEVDVSALNKFVKFSV